ncbi:MAG TPA: hypothetical protein VJQ82_06925 [Terriglobales bacterium]|nr:hypothetical protein [Terriglobales bacterium]
MLHARVTAMLGEGPYLMSGLIRHHGVSPIPRAPTMRIERTTQMGILSRDGDQPTLSFAYGRKPYNGDFWFHTQHLVASVSFIGGLYGVIITHYISPTSRS